MIARWWRRARGRTRLLALLACRDEMRYLPGWFANVAPQVDGIVALDDGSLDGSADFLAAQPKVLALMRAPRRTPHVWEDGANHRRLVEAARAYDPDWLLGVDADERLERDFRRRAEAAIAGGRRRGQRAFYVHVRELWDRPDRMRIDGVWGGKRSARLFAARAHATFHDQRLHGYWAPLDLRGPGGDFPQADLLVYHLRMLHAEDRVARRAKYERLDPQRRFQSIGYEYLTDESGLELAPLPIGRGFEPAVEGVPAAG